MAEIRDAQTPNPCSPGQLFSTVTPNIITLIVDLSSLRIKMCISTRAQCRNWQVSVTFTDYPIIMGPQIETCLMSP